MLMKLSQMDYLLELFISDAMLRSNDLIRNILFENEKDKMVY